MSCFEEAKAVPDGLKLAGIGNSVVKQFCINADHS
jgi:hypothetical protein